MKINTSIKMSAAVLAVILAATLFSLPATSGELGPGKRVQAYSPTVGPYDPVDTIGPFDPGIRVDTGKPGSKKPGVNTGMTKSSSGKSKLGSNGWRELTIGIGDYRFKFKLPVWIPVLSAFEKPGIAE